MVKYITYQDKKYPVRVSFLALQKTQDEIGSEIFTGDNFNLKALIPLLYYSLDAGHHMERKIFEVKRDEIPYMLDECFKEFVQIVTESSGTDNEGKANEGKKKVK